MTKLVTRDVDKEAEYLGWSLHDLHMKAEIAAEGHGYDDGGVAKAIEKQEDEIDLETPLFWMK
ncbi:MAG: hypothetical protein ABJO01_06675 [Parasphingorhabdus sp.]|uniref:hypothetical protein n=1 Tax=Parasphingorhabdus sp. TaxID=2709688 RepID=UPI0032997ECB